MHLTLFSRHVIRLKKICKMPSLKRNCLIACIYVRCNHQAEMYSWPEIRDIEPTFRQRSTALNLKMAATKRSSTRVEYVQLDNFSSVVLYDNSVPRRKKGKIYEVERISRKKEKHVNVIVILDKFTWNI